MKWNLSSVSPKSCVYLFILLLAQTKNLAAFPKALRLTEHRANMLNWSPVQTNQQLINIDALF